MGEKRGPMSEETRQKISETMKKRHAERTAKMANMGTVEAPLPPAAPVNTGQQMSHFPTVPPHLQPQVPGLHPQPTETTKEQDLEFRGITLEVQRAKGFREPTFNGLYWKPNTQGPEYRGWCTQQMSDGSYIIIEHLGNSGMPGYSEER
jgi:hypothetical protein